MSSAVERFRSGLNCAQAVFTSLSPGLDETQARRMAAPFGAGMGRAQEVCGAVSGGLLALGWATGYAEGGDRAGREATYQNTRTLIDQFRQRHGALRCRDLLGLDLQTDDGQAEFRRLGLMTSVCEACVASAEALTSALLASPCFQEEPHV